MKKWICLLVCLFLLGVCASCKSTNDHTGEWHIAEESNREFTTSLQLHITEIDLDNNRVAYEITNNSNDIYGCGTGADFSLEVLHKGVWHNMDHEPGWAITLELHILNPGESKEFTTSLWSELPAGTYRLIKGISLEESSQDNEFICCEFVIE